MYRTDGNFHCAMCDPTYTGKSQGLKTESQLNVYSRTHVKPIDPTVKGEYNFYI